MNIEKWTLPLYDDQYFTLRCLFQKKIENHINKKTAFLLGTLSLCGIPPLACFWSKDEILNDSWLLRTETVIKEIENENHLDWNFFSKWPTHIDIVV